MNKTGRQKQIPGIFKEEPYVMAEQKVYYFIL